MKIALKLVAIIISSFIGMLLLFGIMTNIIIGEVNLMKVNPALNWAIWMAYLVCTMGFIYFLINHFFLKRIKKVSKASEEIAGGNFEIIVEAKAKDEIGIMINNFNKMTAELKANEHLSENFVRNISHEFKTPINSINGFATMIEDECDNEKIKDYARIIQEESKRLTNISRLMLQISLLDSTNIVKKEDVFKPASQIRSIIANLQPDWERKNIEFDVNLDEISITSNEQLLYQVWQNLISNAIKFSPENDKIMISLEKEDEAIKIIVKDNGEGIKEEDKNKIFKQFFVADKSRNSKGTGLGLYISKTIIEKLGGSISFESEVGKGTSFIVKL